MWPTLLRGSTSNSQQGRLSNALPAARRSTRRRCPARKVAQARLRRAQVLTGVKPRRETSFSRDVRPNRSFLVWSRGGLEIVAAADNAAVLYRKFAPGRVPRIAPPRPPRTHSIGKPRNASRSPARELAERAGHARASMSLDVYSHVMPPDEVRAEALLALGGFGETKSPLRGTSSLERRVSRGRNAARGIRRAR
jgi:hypothetical protein